MVVEEWGVGGRVVHVRACVSVLCVYVCVCGDLTGPRGSNEPGGSTAASHSLVWIVDRLLRQDAN